MFIFLQIGFIEHDKCETEGHSRAPTQHTWDDDNEEPVASETDRHVAEIIKHEVKKEFPQTGDNCGADLQGIMDSSSRSIYSGGSSKSNKRKLTKRMGSGLMRKMSIRMDSMTMSKTIEAF